MFGLIGNLGLWELALILLIVLIIFGPGRLPKVGESLGKTLRNIRKASADELEEPDKPENGK